jgi:hypothetical protein
MLGGARASADYVEPVSSNEMEELTALLAKWEGAVSACDYVAVDEDVAVHEPDVIVDEAALSDGGSQDDEDEDPEPVIQPAVALRHCMEFSEFLLQCGEKTDSE